MNTNILKDFGRDQSKGGRKYYFVRYMIVIKPFQLVMLTNPQKTVRICLSRLSSWCWLTGAGRWSQSSVAGAGAGGSIHGTSERWLGGAWGQCTVGNLQQPGGHRFLGDKISSFVDVFSLFVKLREFLTFVNRPLEFTREVSALVPIVQCGEEGVAF